MKHYVLFILLSFMPVASFAQFNVMPDSPLDTSMGDAAGDTTGSLNQLHPIEGYEKEEQQEDLRQEEMLENRYDVPDKEEEEEFNKNGI
ncbi:MAG: hypothetical protein V4598_04040 [Bdellovibrionota bacterium]